jgi:ABC-type antimicrobial peptide transport system permease subunit
MSIEWSHVLQPSGRSCSRYFGGRLGQLTITLSAVRLLRVVNSCTRKRWPSGVVVRSLRGLLAGMPRFDPIALGGAVALLVGCATIALLIPVRRATRVDPMVALRAE